MRAIFCGNFEFDAHQSDLERLFRRYGKVDRVDMKSGFAFVYMDDERDAEDAIRALDRREFGRKGRRLRVEWTKHERGSRKPPRSRRSAANLRPSKTLFVINFPHHTRAKDLERHFDPYGKIANVRIRRNFAFVQYELQDDATRALDATNLSKLLDRIISVEYAAAQEDDKKREVYSPDGRRGREPSPERRKSPSRYTRERGSPNYGRGPSPAPYRTERSSPNYGRRSRTSCSPRRGDRAENPSPLGEKTSADHGDHANRNPSSMSPLREKTSTDHCRASRSPTSCLEERMGPDFLDDSPVYQSAEWSGNGNRNGNGKHSSRIISLDQREEGIIPECDHGASPNGNTESGESPVGDRGSTFGDGYQSHSPTSAHE